ncbi:MAG: DUF1385 domain-containing protein [Clostridia bacterium]|nr:DUF1385 domain-containing protein [Clostridia bacterium]
MREKKPKNCRLNQVGGQAVLEGVMMKAGTRTATACRLPSGSIAVIPNEFVSVRKKHKILNIPIVRGVVNFVEMLILSMKTLTASAEVAASEEDDAPSKSAFAAVSVVATVLGVLLAVALFLFLPKVAVAGIETLFNVSLGVWGAVIEGAIKIAFFLIYLVLVSLMPDIRRTFEYHGAEHKSIACYESGDELTPANAKKHTRFHPRCGTSFLFVMLALGIVIGVLLRIFLPESVIGNHLLYTGIRLLVLPLVVGIGFEYIMFAGKHDNIVTKIFSAPGLWFQRITTREPDESQLEVAITALMYAHIDAFPDFDREAVTYHPKEKAEDDGAEKAETPVEDAPAETPKTPDAPAPEAAEEGLPSETAPAPEDAPAEEKPDETL